MDTALIEFEEHGSLREDKNNPYELNVIVKIGDRMIFDVPYVTNSLNAIKGMASDISSRLEARGFTNIPLVINSINKSGNRLLQIEGFEHLLANELKINYSGDIKIKSIPFIDTR